MTHLTPTTITTTTCSAGFEPRTLNVRFEHRIGRSTRFSTNSESAKKSQWAFFDFCTKLYWQRSTQIWSKSESFQSYLFQIGFFFLFFVENDSSIYFVFSFFFQMSPNSNRSQSFNKTFWQKGKTRKEEEKEKSLILKWIVLSKEKRPWAVLGATFHFPSQTNFTVFLKRLISFQELAI